MIDRKPYALDTTINEFGRLIWSFTRYCAGRRTYAPSICEDIIRRNAEIILFPWRALIISHVMGAFAQSFEARVVAERVAKEAKEAGDPDWWQKGYKGGPLGEGFDENGWVQAVTYLAKHDDADPALVEACWNGDDAPVVAKFDDVDSFWFMVCGALRNDYAQGEDAVWTVEGLTEFIKAHCDDLNPKWIHNFHRDLTDDVYTSFLANGDDGTADAWRELREMMTSLDVGHP